MRKSLLLLAAALLLLSCQGGRQRAERQHRGIYYWKTDFSISPSDSAFLADHRIDRIYLRFFDVILANKAITGYTGAIPNASVTFSSRVPEGVEIVPVVFITLEALKDMTYGGKAAEVAAKIDTRLDAMVRANGVGPVREVQVDCDYTERTQEGFFAFCRALGALLEKRGVTLSSTLRLHQLRGEAPPVSSVSLMLYNTGNFRDPDAGNSILEPEIVRNYLRGRYKLPATVALPVYGWGVWMRDGKYRSLLHKSDYSDTTLYRAGDDGRYEVLRDHIVEGHDLLAGDQVRLELSPYETVSEVHDYALDKLGGGDVILYHLDSLCLSRYTFEQIETLYSYAND